MIIFLIVLTVFVWLFAGFMVAGYCDEIGMLSEGTEELVCCLLGLFSLAMLLGCIMGKKARPK